MMIWKERKFFQRKGPSYNVSQRSGGQLPLRERIAAAAVSQLTTRRPTGRPSLKLFLLYERQRRVDIMRAHGKTTYAFVPKTTIRTYLSQTRIVHTPFNYCSDQRQH
ncbi:hypothetical protein CBL_01847 [Carabus blaptoides fortunei]